MPFDFSLCSDFLHCASSKNIIFSFETKIKRFLKGYLAPFFKTASYLSVQDILKKERHIFL